MELHHGNIFKSISLINKLYDDVLHSPAKEIGLLLGNIAKTICIFGYPFMKGAKFKDDISKKVFEIAESVPENLRVIPYPQLFLDYLDKTKYIPDKSILMQSFDKLLASAINKEKRDFVHPAFIVILAQLSDDEVSIISHLKNEEFKLKQKYYLDYQTAKFYKSEIIENEYPLDKLHNKDMFFMYWEHLTKLNLVNSPLNAQEFEKDSEGRQTGEIKTFTLTLSEFGKLFAEACCPN